jgi:hypothetical protein
VDTTASEDCSKVEVTTLVDPFDELRCKLEALQKNCVSELKAKSLELQSELQTETEKVQSMQLKLQRDLQLKSDSLNLKVRALHEKCALDLKSGAMEAAAALMSSLEAKAEKLESEKLELRSLSTVQVFDVDANIAESVQLSPAAAVSLKRSREEMESSSSSNSMKSAADVQNVVKVKQEKLSAAAAGKGRAEDDLEAFQNCVVCFDNPRRVVFRPCSHFVVCESCAAALKQSNSNLCPLCKAPIEGIIRGIQS